jgi:predicted secreted Zn-dependent protease
MNRLAMAFCLTFALCQVAGATTVERSFSYFTIGGQTLSEIEEELNRRGPRVETTDRRHPGATRMQFVTRVSYGEQSGTCGVIEANVSLSAEMILPRWRVPRDPDMETRIIWDTLAADIRRHEEAHVVIARNHARELEQALGRVTRQPDCEVAADKVAQVTADVLRRHEEAQAQFDRIEAVNFERRLLRLLRYRLDRMADGRLPMP